MGKENTGEEQPQKKEETELREAERQPERERGQNSVNKQLNPADKEDHHPLPNSTPDKTFLNFWESPQENGIYYESSDVDAEFVVTDKCCAESIEWYGSEILINSVEVGNHKLFPFGNGENMVLHEDEENIEQILRPNPRMCCACSLRDFFESLDNLLNCKVCRESNDFQKVKIVLECVPPTHLFVDADWVSYFNSVGNIQPLKDLFEFGFGFKLEKDEAVEKRLERQKIFEKSIDYDYDYLLDYVIASGRVDDWKLCISNLSDEGEKCLAPDCSRSHRGAMLNQISIGLQHFFQFAHVHESVESVWNIEMTKANEWFKTFLLAAQTKHGTSLREIVTVQIEKTVFVLGKTFYQTVPEFVQQNLLPDNFLTSEVESANFMSITSLFASPLLEKVLKTHQAENKKIVHPLKSICGHFLTKHLSVTHRPTENVVCTKLLKEIHQTLSGFVFSAIATGLVADCKELLGLLAVSFSELVQKFRISKESRIVSFRQCKICKFCKNLC